MKTPTPKNSMQDAPPRKNIAVIGSGISGLSCAWLLSKSQNVTLFEKDDRLGGHSNTVTFDLDNGPSASIPDSLSITPSTTPTW